MFALPPKAGIDWHHWHVLLVPRASHDAPREFSGAEAAKVVERRTADYRQDTRAPCRARASQGDRPARAILSVAACAQAGKVTAASPVEVEFPRKGLASNRVSGERFT